jgi:N-methylhydantoinase A
VNMVCYLGVDVGGTFTDLVVYDADNKKSTVVKVPTQSDEPERGVVTAIAESGVASGSAAMIVHGTTIATNALLTGTGLAKVALVTNNGFRDILEIGRQRRPELYNPFFSKPRPLVPRAHRFTLKCRINYKGEELVPPDAGEAGRLAEKIVGMGFDAVAVVFLHSYVNPAHELFFAKTLREKGFRGHISLSHEVDPQHREYERTSTTVVNASLTKIVSSYLKSLDAGLRSSGFTGKLYVMCSDGGCVDIGEASARPVSIIESGPAAGVLASAYLSRRLNIRKLITFDMGGTTAKAGAVIEGQPQVVYEFEAAGKTHSGRSIKGSGYTVRYPFIDLVEVSAGGGTIAWIDEGGGLRVGPRSAGAKPGPAAYGRGGVEPTVTDANIVLGRLNPNGLLDSRVRLYPELAQAAYRDLGHRLGLSMEDSAISVVRLVNSVMGRAIELVSLDKGRDPRDFWLIAFGGAGPMHACDLAEEVGVEGVIVPPNPGVFSAHGLLATDFVRHYTRTVLCPPHVVDAELGVFREEVQGKLKAEGFDHFRLQEYVDMRYVGQSYELTIPYTSDLTSSFNKAHAEVYGYSSPDPVEAVCLRIRATVDLPKADVKGYTNDGTESPAPVFRRAWIGGRFHETPVHRRDTIPGGWVSEGPLIIEEYTSTTIVNPGWTCRMNEDGVLVLNRGVN